MTTRDLSKYLWLPVLSLLTLGMLFSYSTSSVVSAARFSDEFLFAKRHGLALLVAISAGVFSSWLPLYAILKRFRLAILALSFALLGATLLPGVGKTVGGASRWIGMGGFSFQPGEWVKFSLVLFFSSLLADASDPYHPGRWRTSHHKPLLWSFFAFAAFICCFVLQPDYGSCVVLTITLLFLCTVAGIPLKKLALFAGSSALCLGGLLILAPYRLKRLTAFLNPLADPHGGGFQTVQSLQSIASGGWLGRGLGSSQQKLFFLPEAHTDFVLSIICEEMGWLGITAIILAYGLLCGVLVAIAKRCLHLSEKLYITGVLAILFSHCAINMGVAVGLLPTKGIPLPFLSVGGSSLVTNLLMIGLCQNILFHCPENPSTSSASTSAAWRPWRRAAN